MLHPWQRVRAAFAAYRIIKKRRARTGVLRNALLEHCVQQLAHDNVVLQAAAFAAKEQDVAPKRVVPRCLGKWRCSTLSGYLRHDDITYRENFRCTRQQLDGLVMLLAGTALDAVDEQRVRQARLVERPRAARWTAKARAVQDPPTLRYKVGLCLYAIGQGGPVKVLADAGGVGTSSLRRYLSQFADAVMAAVAPIYMPSKPMPADERAAVQGQFASRRGIQNVMLACDGSHIPFRPKSKKIAGEYRNYKGWTSILAVAFVDSYYRFFALDVGYPGRAGDNTVLARSGLMADIGSDPDKWLGQGGMVLGDSGASDSNGVFMNPYHAPTEADKCWFNFCHSSTRFFVEQTFGTWKSRFRFLLHTMPGANHKLTTKLIYASAVLHNYLVGNRGDFNADVSQPCWSKHFESFKAHMCPMCKASGKAHCIHQATFRNGVAQVVHARKAPSEVRDTLCAHLWDAVCENEAVRREMQIRATEGIRR